MICCHDLLRLVEESSENLMRKIAIEQHPSRKRLEGEISAPMMRFFGKHQITSTLHFSAAACCYFFLSSVIFFLVKQGQTVPKISVFFHGDLLLRLVSNSMC